MGLGVWYPGKHALMDNGDTFRKWQGREQIYIGLRTEATTECYAPGLERTTTLHYCATWSTAPRRIRWFSPIRRDPRSP